MNPYNIQLDVKFGHQELIDLAPIIKQHEPWFNQTLTKVNNSVVRLGIVQGEFHWHKHDEDDEFFFVADDLEGEGCWLRCRIEGRDGFSVDGLNDVTGLQAGFRSRCRGLDVDHEQAGSGAEL